MVTPPSSITSALCEETTSLVLTPQTITDVVINKPSSIYGSMMRKVEEVIRDVIFSPSTRDKKKRLQKLRVSFY